MSYDDFNSNRNNGGFNGGFNGNSNSRPTDRPRYSPAPRYEAPAAPVVQIPKIPVDPKSRDMMFFKGNYYSIELLRAQSKGGPLIEISRSELLGSKEIIQGGFTANVTASRELSAEVLDLAPVFAKYEGKYVVLLGYKGIAERLSTLPDVADVKFKGRLLSNPALKRCIV